MRPALRVRTAALLVTVGLLLAGCVAYDPLVPRFEVKNLTGQHLNVTPANRAKATFQATPGERRFLPVLEAGCESFGWVATFDSGTIVAKIPGGCLGHLWTIRGVNDSTYE